METFARGLPQGAIWPLTAGKLKGSVHACPLEFIAISGRICSYEQFLAKPLNPAVFPKTSRDHGAVAMAIKITSMDSRD